jgi:hypothetical protein
MTVNCELGRMRKKVFMVYFKVLIQNLPGGNEENHENISHNDRPLGRKLNVRPHNMKKYL